MSAQPIGEYDRIVSRREALVERLSPAARHARFPQIYARPEPVADILGMKKKIEELESENHRLQGEVQNLRSLMMVGTLESVVRHFCIALAATGYLVEGERISVDDLKAKGKTPAYSRPRHVAIWLCRQLCEFPLVRIARHFNRLDHTTVIWSCQRAPMVMEQFPMLAQAANAVLAARRVPA